MSIGRKIRHNLAYMAFLAVMIAFSGYFTCQVEAFRARTSKAKLTATLESGTEVVVEQIIDGDEIGVHAEQDRSFVVRILGIKSFDPVVNDPAIGIFGRSSVAYLEERLAGKAVRVVFDTFSTDQRDRLLAYVHLGDEDVGKSLVERGLAPVFVAYPFTREAEYLQAQAEARAAHRGLWGVPEAAQRVEALIEIWNAERKE